MRDDPSREPRGDGHRGDPDARGLPRGGQSPAREGRPSTGALRRADRTYRRGLGTLELQREINRARHSGGTLVLTFADVDGLKDVNDPQRTRRR